MRRKSPFPALHESIRSLSIPREGHLRCGESGFDDVVVSVLSLRGRVASVLRRGQSAKRARERFRRSIPTASPPYPGLVSGNMGNAALVLPPACVRLPPLLLHQRPGQRRRRRWRTSHPPSTSRWPCRRRFTAHFPARAKVSRAARVPFKPRPLFSGLRAFIGPLTEFKANPSIDDDEEDDEEEDGYIGGNIEGPPQRGGER